MFKREISLQKAISLLSTINYLYVLKLKCPFLMLAFFFKERSEMPPFLSWCWFTGKDGLSQTQRHGPSYNHDTRGVVMGVGSNEWRGEEEKEWILEILFQVFFFFWIDNLMGVDIWHGRGIELTHEPTS